MKDVIKKIGEDGQTRGWIALYDLWGIAAAVVSMASVLIGWWRESMFTPLVAIITAFVAYMAIRIAMEPGIVPAAQTWARKKAGLPDKEKPVEAPTKPANSSNSPSLQEYMARWHLLKNQVFELDAINAEIEHLKPQCIALLNSPSEGKPAEKPQALREWDNVLQRLDIVFGRCFQEDSNIARMRYTVGAHPVPEHLGLSPSEEVAYRRFYDQVTALETEGAQLSRRVRDEERGVRAQIFRVGEEVKVPSRH